ncbi:MAG: NosD domain-containing protein [Acidobacteriaceae bacterium]
MPAGNWSFATTIHLPSMGFGTYGLQLDPGTVLTYTGKADAIAAPAYGLFAASLLIEGGQLIGTPAAAAGIHTFPTNQIVIRNMVIRDFTGGDGIRIEGANTVDILQDVVVDNRVGIHLIGTHCLQRRDSRNDLICDMNLQGAGYAPNAIHVIGNMITQNTQWGIWEDFAPRVTAALNNLYLGNNLESNGDRKDHGAMWLAYSRATQVEANYFEGPAPYIRIGAADWPPSVGVAVRGNYFTTNAAVPVTLDLVNAEDTMIEDNSQYDAFPSATPCFVNLGKEKGTYLGKNHLESTSIACRGGKPAQLPASAWEANPGPPMSAPGSIGRFVGQLTTSANPTDALKAADLTPAGHCAAFAADAKGSTLTGVYAEAGNGSVTVHHAGQAGGKLNVFCSLE